MSWPALPLFAAVAGKPVILIGAGEAADAKRRLLERAGAVIVGENDAEARLAIVAVEDDAEAEATAAALKARGVLVNVVDRPALCDFTVPAIIDRAPVLVAVGTGGVSAGLAAALRQRLESLLPARLGALAIALFEARAVLRARFGEPRQRRAALSQLLSPGGPLDPLRDHDAIDVGAAVGDISGAGTIIVLSVASDDPDNLTLREARMLANADRVYHDADVGAAIVDRARADATRIVGRPPALPEPGLTIVLEKR